MATTVSDYTPFVVHSVVPLRWFAQSASDPTTAYEVFEIAATGGWRCTCPAGQRGIGCKHVRWVIAEKAMLSQLLGQDVELLYRDPQPGDHGPDCAGCWQELAKPQVEGLLPRSAGQRAELRRALDTFRDVDPAVCGIHDCPRERCGWECRTGRKPA